MQQHARTRTLTGADLVPTFYSPDKAKKPMKNTLRFSRDTKEKLIQLRATMIDIAGDLPAPLILGNREKIKRNILKSRDLIDELLRVI